MDATPHGHWLTTALVAGLKASEIVTPLVIDGPMTGNVLRAYVEQMLAPSLEPGDMVVLDNLAAHKPAGVAKAIRSVGEPAGTLDALASYTGSGGRLVYLGSNGLYWRIGRHSQMPGVIEIRRAEGGIRAWEAEPGEYHNAFDGPLGGLWRRNRRPPQALVGVGFSGQGLFEGTHNFRTTESYEADHAWIFEGVEGELVGGYGLSGGGAAGFELDRAITTSGCRRMPSSSPSQKTRRLVRDGSGGAPDAYGNGLG